MYIIHNTFAVDVGSRFFFFIHYFTDTFVIYTNIYIKYFFKLSNEKTTTRFFVFFFVIV